MVPRYRLPGRARGTRWRRSHHAHGHTPCPLRPSLATLARVAIDESASKDTLFLGRAHSLGWRRQHVEMPGWVAMVDALTMAWYRAAEAPRSGRLTRSSSSTTRRGSGCPESTSVPKMAFHTRPHLHSLHFNALEMTSVAMAAGFSTGPGQVWPCPRGLRAREVPRRRRRRRRRRPPTRRASRAHPSPPRPCSAPSGHSARSGAGRRATVGARLLRVPGGANVPIWGERLKMLQGWFLYPTGASGRAHDGHTGGPPTQRRLVPERE